MSIEEKIRRMQGELARVRPCHPARIPSWVAAAALAAGLTVVGGACTTERHTETPAGDMTGMDPGPGDPLYAGPPPPRDMDAPDNVPAYAGPPPDGDLYGGPPMDDEDGANPPPAPVPAYDGPPMR